MEYGSVFKIKMAFWCVLGALSCFVSSSVPTIPGNSLPYSPCSAQYPCLWWEYWIRCHFISGGCWWALWGELEHIETKAWLLSAFSSTKAKFPQFSCGPLVVLVYFVRFDRLVVGFCTCFLGTWCWNIDKNNYFFFNSTECTVNIIYGIFFYNGKNLNDGCWFRNKE